ncbi:14493_t:CDS:2 [Entrophospora sp. SA101]|nr:14488_t:CDS:2 [Entrophospora sp. SA101]CAJ0626368.1 14493_t:CDS:2 [Entrophospora sp. SA101]CAJ0828090.1 15579_t:CDS:2 [Entrophospora sp. SA101]CAJ0829784.1 4559_t:CDS:2 [Entrophospora sp. SA101]CAJ0845781.1 12781_t:CDS:2 [Entrophospora sp. SA101]
MTASIASIQFNAKTTTKQQFASTPKAWIHFVAGGLGGMVGAIVTSPLDVVKTRLQHIYLYYFFSDVYRIEGSRALFKGLGPNLIGVVPARAINFFTYGNGKIILIELNDGKETPLIHLTAAIIAGITTSTVINPIWLVKTRMQLQSSNKSPQTLIKYKSSFDCIRKVIKNEGFIGLYKGLSASYLGVTESTIQWVLYESFKSKFAEKREKERINNNKRNGSGSLVTQLDNSFNWRWIDNLLAAGSAKLMAACVTYPHEVIRTRMRQLPGENGVRKYKGLIRCIKTIFKEEGFKAFYGGMSAHMMRVVPNAAIIFFCYESILSYSGANQKR